MSDPDPGSAAVLFALEEVVARYPDLAPDEPLLWIERRWLRAEAAPGGSWLLTEVDVARLALLVELRVTLEVTEELMPLVLSLVDQLYDARRAMRCLMAALDSQPEEVRAAVVAAARRYGQNEVPG